MKQILNLISILLITVNLFAQAPQRISYQAVIRNSSNALVTSKAIGMRVSILQGSDRGTEVYKEIYNPNPQTNANGLVSIEIGGGIPITGTFPGINWANGPYFIKTETDPTGGTNYTISGTSQLLSVPYALYAGNVINGGGKPILYIAGDITNAQAQAKITAEVGSNTQSIIIDNCSALTAIDLSMITDAVQIEFDNNENLQSINLSKLATCRYIYIEDCPKLNTLNISGLKQLGYLGLDKTALTSLSLNSLTASVKFACEISSNPSLTSISIPTISKAGYIYFNDNKILSSMSLPALQTAEGISISGSTSLTSLSFPALTTVGNIGIYSNTNLASIQLPVLANRLIDNINNSFFGYNFYSNKLASSQINTLLNRLVNLTPTFSGVFINLGNQTPPAPPTGQGLIDKATLESRGNTVQTD